MQHSTGSATKAELARFRTIQSIGCIACRLKLGEFMECEIQHLLLGGRRMGHIATIGLCPWHHRSVPLFGMGRREMEAIYGPSLAYGTKPFAAAFGSDQDLLYMQDAMIAKYREAVAA